MLAALLCVPLASGAQCVPAVAASGDSTGTYRYGEGDTIFFGSYALDGYRFARWEVTYISGGEIEIDTLDAEYANGYYIPAVYWIELDTVVFRAYFEAGRPDSTTATYAVNDASLGTTIPAPGTARCSGAIEWGRSEVSAGAAAQPRPQHFFSSTVHNNCIAVPLSLNQF